MNANKVLQSLLATFTVAIRLENVDVDVPKDIAHELGKMVTTSLALAVNLIQEQYNIPDSEIDIRLQAIDEYIACIRREHRNND